MKSVTFGNSYKLSFQKQPDLAQDNRRVKLSQQDIADYQVDDSKLEKISKEFFDSADRVSAQGKVQQLLQKRGINSFIHTGPNGKYLLTSGPDVDTLNLYHQVRDQHPELCHIDRARDFDQKLIEAGVINPDTNPAVNVKYALNTDGDSIKLTNKPEIRQAVLGGN